MSPRKKIKVNLDNEQAESKQREDDPRIAAEQQAARSADVEKEDEASDVQLEKIEPATAEEISLSPDEIKKLIQERDENYDRLLRTKADFDNYRKRMQREQADLLRYGAKNALLEILPVVDNFERAVNSARAHQEPNTQLREGVELIRTQFLDILKKLGVTPVETIGHPFDPNKHDALIRVHAPDAAEGTVVEEVRKGYYLHDKVLRPAQVTVGTQESVEG